MQIALLEDAPDQAELMQLWLESAGHKVHHFPTGAAYMEGMKKEKFDLVILDWLLPDTNGIEMLEWTRDYIDWPIPVLFVTQQDSDEDIVYALEKGADDYMAKPVKGREMLARIKSLGRRGQRQDAVKRSNTYGEYVIDSAARVITRSGERIELTQKEFDLAFYLFKHLGEILPREDILEKIWGRTSDISTRTIDTHVSRLRKKMSLTPARGWRLSAIYQFGYRLEELNQD